MLVGLGPWVPLQVVVEGLLLVGVRVPWVGKDSKHEIDLL